MNKVTVYTTSSCPFCIMLKNYFTENNIPFEEINLERHPEKMEYVVGKTGQMGVPQTEVNGKWVIGFDPERIERELN